MSIQNQVNFLYKKNNVSIEEKMSVADIQKEKSIHDSFARLICSNRGYKILVKQIQEKIDNEKTRQKELLLQKSNLLEKIFGSEVKILLNQNNFIAPLDGRLIKKHDKERNILEFEEVKVLL